MRRIGFAALLLACSSNDPQVAPADSGPVSTDSDDIPKCDLAVSKGPWTVAVDGTSAKVRWESCQSGGGALTLNGKRIDSKVSQAIVTTTNDVPLRRTADRAGTYFMHEVALTALEPATCFDYTLTQDETAKGRFCTARKPGDTLSFAAIGDTNPGLGDITKMLDTAYGTKPDFTIHAGDIQYYSSGLESYGFWMDKMRPMLRTGAFYPSIGNHETEKPMEREEYIERFWGKPGFDGNSDFYRFESGGVWFFALNTEIDMDEKSSQGTWLATQLEDAAKRPGYRFSVVFLHRPFVTCGDSGQNDALRKVYEPLFTRTKVKLIVAGHMHGYERFEFGDITWITSAGGGSKPGNVDENIARPECVDRKAKGTYWNMTVFTVKPGELSGVTYDEKGAPRDTFMRAVP